MDGHKIYNIFVNICKRSNEAMAYTIKVNGMMCGHCASRVQKAIENVGGVSGTTVNLDSKTVTVNADIDTLEKVKAAVNDAGYEAE